MVAGMKYRDIAKALVANGCTWRDGKGSHVMWYCPCGQHSVPVQVHREVSNGVVHDVISKLKCLPKGWLQ